MGRFLRRSVASQLPVGAAALRLLNAFGITFQESPGETGTYSRTTIHFAGAPLGRPYLHGWE